MRWARGCYLSRRFPPRLLDAEAPSTAVHKSNCRGASTHWLIAHRSTGAPGVLLPFFDLLNHGKGTEIEWRGDGTSVAFAAGAAIAPNSEIFNNYGAKANDELLLAHGFALTHNEHDRVALKLTVASGDGRNTLGPFYLRRGGEQWPIPQPIPHALWRALADPTGDPASSESDSPPEVDAEAVDMLLTECERKLAPFKTSEIADAKAALGAGRLASVAFYRIGQREILEDAVEALRSMLG